MVDVTSPADSAEKFGRRGSQAQQDYRDGIERTTDSDWSEGTLDNVSNWEQAIQEAISNGAFESGVRNPSASWNSRALELGTQRFGPGIQASTGKYEQAVIPFFEALEALTLEPRGPRGSSQNFQRSERVGRRLHELRQSR